AAHILLYASIAQTLRTLDAGVFAASPQRLAMACGDGAGLRFRERHALRKQAQALRLSGAAPSRADLAAALSGAAQQLAQWRGLATGKGLPALPAAHAELGGPAAEGGGQLGAPPRRGAATSGCPPTPNRCSRNWWQTRTRPGSCRGCTSLAPGSTTAASARCWTSWPAGRPRRPWPRPLLTMPGTPRSWRRSGSATLV